MTSRLARETTELLRQMIRNACVNDGTAATVGEATNTSLLADILRGPGLDLEIYEPVPGRTSLVARIEGSVPEAPSLALMGHTDVVPASAGDWQHDPFEGALVGDEVWGRGAVDMLNLTSSMAIATRDLARSGFRPRGDLVFLAVADEEDLGVHGAKWLTENVPEVVRTDYLITEAGGWPTDTPAGTRLPVMTAEKGAFWCSLHLRGTPGHGSLPLRTDNALVKAAEVVRRLAEHAVPAEIHDSWRDFVSKMGFPGDLADSLLDPARIDSLLERLPMLGLARLAHACTHTTLAPTMANAGSKTNVIPDSAELSFDVRVLPGWTRKDVEAMFDDALGDMAAEVEVRWRVTDEASLSPAHGPLWDSIERAARHAYDDAVCVPLLMTGITDARFFRRLGTTAYGFGLFSRRIGFEQYATMFHGTNERVDVESLELSTRMWSTLAMDLLLGAEGLT